MSDLEDVIHYAIEKLEVSHSDAEIWVKEVIPSFGLTPEQLVADGYIEQVKDHIDRIAEGGYA